MNKTLRLILLGLTMILLFVGTANASPFLSLGWVNPNLNSSWDKEALTGKAQYSFNILDSHISVNTIDLFFESDVFAINPALTVEAVTPGWTFSFTQNGNDTHPGYWLTGTAGTSAAVSASTAPLTFIVNYKLLSADRYIFGAGSDNEIPWEWNQAQGGGPWSQDYLLSDSFTFGGRRATFDISGGSTAPIPEPSTMLLLVTGLVGLVACRRKRQG